MSDQERSKSRSRSRSRDTRRRSRSPEDDYRSRKRSSSRDRQPHGGDRYGSGSGNGRYNNNRYDNNDRRDNHRGEFRNYGSNNFNSSGGPPQAPIEGFQMNPDAAPFQPNPPININNFPGRQQRPQQYQHGGFQQQHRQPFQKAPFRNTNGWSSLPEEECCTLQITGIQQHVTESDLLTHFRSFGRVVNLRFSGQEEGGTGEHKECLVQYESPADAKKCFNSPKAVLNNRFIKLLQAPYNIVPIAEVEAYIANNPYPSEEEPTRGRQPFRKSYQSHTPAFNGPPTFNGPAAHKYAYKQNTSWRQSDEEKPPAAPMPTAADQAVLTQHSEIKRLREQKQALARKKEEVVRAQIQKFHDMLDKLQKSESGKNLMENLEGKIFELQQQLTDLQQQQLD